MSSSDGTPHLRLAAATDEMRALAEETSLSAEGVRQALVAAALLYGAAVRRAGHEISLANPDLTPTDVVVVCSAFLRALDLNPFDLTLWFGRVVPDPGTGSTPG